MFCATSRLLAEIHGVIDFLLNLAETVAHAAVVLLAEIIASCLSWAEHCIGFIGEFQHGRRCGRALGGIHCDVRRRRGRLA